MRRLTDPERWYDVFRPTTGRPIATVPWRWLARLLAWHHRADFALVGDGWV